MAPGSGNGTFAWTDRAEFSNDMILEWLSPHRVLGAAAYSRTVWPIGGGVQAFGAEASDQGEPSHLAQQCVHRRFTRHKSLSHSSAIEVTGFRNCPKFLLSYFVFASF
jgi:hypothetical protein